jgi:hypothetical protein
MGSVRLVVLICLGLLSIIICGAGAARKSASLQGSLIVNGETIDLPYVYAFTKPEGLKEKSDPAWELLFVQRPLKQRVVNIAEVDSPCVRIGVVETRLFDEEPQIRVNYQEFRSIPGIEGVGSPTRNPKIKIITAGPERITGRIFYAETQQVQDAAFHYDYRFDVPLIGPYIASSEHLSSGEETPGAAYLAWVSAVHAGDKEKIKSLLPADQADVVDAPVFISDLKFIQKMTPDDVRVDSESRRGKTALLEVTGTMAGEEVKGKVKMKYLEGKWVKEVSKW